MVFGYQVCALFNGRTNKSNARFTCPTCYINVPTSEESREKARKIVKGAEDLPRCKMSDALEKGLHDALRAAYVTRSNELGVDVEDVEKSEGLCVRVLSNVEKKSVVGEKVCNLKYCVLHVFLMKYAKYGLFYCSLDAATLHGQRIPKRVSFTIEVYCSFSENSRG